jgi:endonuclease YncB( thermonuclease family)
MECLPPLSDDVESDAWPLLRTTVLSEVEPSKNSTVPVAVDGETVAVKVTTRPLFDGFGSDVNVIVVLAWFTV